MSGGVGPEWRGNGETSSFIESKQVIVKILQNILVVERSVNDGIVERIVL